MKKHLYMTHSLKPNFDFELKFQETNYIIIITTEVLKT